MAAESAQFDGGRAAPANVPRRTDFIDRAVDAEVSLRIAEGRAIPIMITGVAARDFGQSAGLMITGVLPGGRQAVAAMRYYPWFDVVAAGGQTHEELEAQIRAKELEFGAGADVVSRGAAKLSAGLETVVRHRALPWKGGMFHDKPPAVIRFFYRTVAAYDCACRSANIYDLHTRWDAKRSGEDVKMMRYLGLKSGTWFDLKECAGDPPVCGSCRKHYAKWADCECGKEGCDKCGRSLFSWSRASCGCSEFRRAVFSQFDHGRGTALLMGDLLPGPAAGGADAMAVRAAARVGEHDASNGWADQDALDGTPLFEVTYDIETCWRPGHNNGGPPPPGHPETHMILAAFTLSRSDRAEALATVVVADTAVPGRSRLMAGIARGDYDNEVAYSFETEPARGSEFRDALKAEAEKACPSGWAVVQTRYNNQAMFAQAMAAVVRAFNPDVLMGYNSHNYDEPFWKCEAARAMTGDEEAERLFFNTLTHFRVGKDPFKWNWRSGDVKISEAGEKRQRFDGASFVSVDVMMQIKRIYREGVPDASRGGKPSFTLDAMLRHHDLRTKLASDFVEMDRAWLARDRKRLGWDALYCVFDAVGTMMLAHEAGVVASRVALGTYGYCTLEHSFERGDGMRIEGAFINEAAGRGYLVTNAKADSKDPQISGAWVMAPWPGPKQDVLVSFDVNSQYPSVAMALNLSPESVTDSEELARAAGRRLGRPVREIHATFAHDEAPPIRGWVVGHGGAERDYATIPHVFAFLMRERNVMKAVAKEIEKAMKALLSQNAAPPSQNAALTALCEKIGPEWGLKPCPVQPPEFYAEMCGRLERKLAVAKKREKAVKVNMNTGYGRIAQRIGALLDILSPLLAGAITYYSREVIRIAVRVAAEFRPVAGVALTHEYTDTDSLYVNATALLPPDLREAFMHAVGEDRRQAILAARKFLEPHMFELQRRMNDALAAEIGREVSLKYEGMHMKSWMQKCKYYVSLLLKTEKEDPDPPLTVTAETVMRDLNICGVDIVKRTCSPLIKNYIVHMIVRVFDLHRPWPLDDEFREMARAIVDDFTGARSLDGGPGKELDPAALADSGVWRADRHTPAMACFAERMAARFAEYSDMKDPPLPPGLFAPPQNGVRFRYVVVGHENELAVNGRRIKRSVGERMEYLEAYQWTLAHPERGVAMSLDYAHYADKGLATRLGAMIAFLPEFFTPDLQKRWLEGGDARNDAIAESGRNAARWVTERVNATKGPNAQNPTAAKRRFRECIEEYYALDREFPSFRVGGRLAVAAGATGAEFSRAVGSGDDTTAWLQSIDEQARRMPLPSAADAARWARTAARQRGLPPPDMARLSVELGLNTRRPARTSAGRLLLDALSRREYALREEAVAARRDAVAASAAIADEFLARMKSDSGATMKVDAAARGRLREAERAAREYVAAVRARTAVARTFEHYRAAHRSAVGASGGVRALAAMAAAPPAA